MNELVTIAEMRALEKAAVDRGIPEEALMEQAGKGLAEFLARRMPHGATLVVFAGKGHNAGDAFVAARILEAMGRWRIQVRLAYHEQEMRPLALAKFRELSSAEVVPLDAPFLTGGCILLDGVLGIGFEGELRGVVKQACDAMNRWRNDTYADVVAVDIPSGLGSAGCVTADTTVTLGYPKQALVEDAATAFVGQIVVVPLADLEVKAPGDFVITAGWVRQVMPGRRNFDTHKGKAGRVGIVAGSRGCTGAARLASAAAVRAGAGLVTLFVPEEIYPVVAASAIPEVMVRTISDIKSVQADVWGIGPGLGTDPLPGLLDWMGNLTTPVVLDADALNWISIAGLCGLEAPAGPRLLTPHPGEMRRLLAGWRPELASESRACQASEFARAFGVTLLLKGSRTVIAQRGLPLAYNSTGTPWMATGGMGDVLTGVTAALMSQGLDPFAAGGVGSWLLGRAGEISAPHGLGAGLALDALHAARLSVIDL